MGGSYGTPEVYVNGVDLNVDYSTTTRDDLHTAIVTNGASHSNGAIVVHEGADTNASTPWTSFGISGYGGFFFEGKLTELIIYNTDQSANREGIEKDMALHSGAFQVEDAPLLDAYGGAHAAYSLRKLNSDYTGYAARVRRDSDGTELDVGFDSDGNLDTAATDAFYDGTNIRIKTWYDQSGNGNDTTQTTSYRPLIYNNVGRLEVRGRTALYFNGSTLNLPFDSTGLDIGNLSTFVVCKANSTGGTQRIVRFVLMRDDSVIAAACSLREHHEDVIVGLIVHVDVKAGLILE